MGQKRRKISIKIKQQPMYYLLTERFKSCETKLVQLILESVNADRIYLLGSELSTRRAESVFVAEAPSCKYVSRYFLLVLTKGNEDVNVIAETIENKAKQLVPVTAMVMSTLTFTAWLHAGHPFTHTVHTKAVLLFRSEEEEITPVETGAADIREKNHSVYNAAKNKVTEFIAGADLFMLRKQTKLAAFMFHQAAEQCLHALFEINTGMYLNTHSIDKLLRYGWMICYRLPEIFPRNNEKEERLFQLLQKAYVGARYEKDYSITLCELEKIRGMVMELKEVLREFGE
jgi:HEPN domain-containing protein